MGKAALLAIAALVVMGTYYGASTHRGMLDTTDRVADFENEVIARNAALAGYNRAKQHLAGSFSGISGEKKDYGEGEYTLDIKLSGSYADIVSRGRSGSETYTVFAKIQEEKIFPILQEPPKFMKYSFLTDKDLTLNGNVLFDTFRVAGTEELKYNANIHTNGKLTVKGKAATIRGFGTYVTGADVKHTVVFKPYENPTGDPVIQKVEKVQIPILDPEAIAETVSADMTSGSVSLSGNYDFRTAGKGTRENPYIWVINGNLNASGNVRITGYAMFLVSGNINFSGNVTVGQHLGPSESNFAFYAGGDVDFGGNTEVWGQIFCKGDAKFHGTPKIVGNISIGGNAKVSGTPDILYLPASPALTKVFQEPETRLRMVSYAER